MASSACTTAVTVGSLILAGSHQILLSALYQSHIENVGDGILALTVMILVCMVLAVITQKILPYSIATRSILLTVFVYSAYMTVRSHLLVMPDSNTMNYVFGLLPVLTAAVIYFSKYFVLDRFFMAMAVAGLVFTIVPLAIGCTPAKRTEVFGVRSIDGLEVYSNRMIVLLDEWDPKWLPTIANALADTGLDVQSTTIESAGVNTLNAIPSMLTGARHDNVSPCGVARLCGSQSFSFKAAKPQTSTTDVVGMYHPYCSIPGLRSCYLSKSNHSDHWTEPFRYLFVHFFEPMKKFLPLVQNPSDIYQSMSVRREKIETQVNRAPFWQAGGTLYLHLPLPHPPSNEKAESLLAEYEMNVSKAAELVTSYSFRLRAKFGSNFVLVVTSDHPLRQNWCNAPGYKSARCWEEIPPTGSKVPLVVSAVSLPKIALPKSAVGLLGQFTQ